MNFFINTSDDTALDASLDSSETILESDDEQSAPVFVYEFDTSVDSAESDTTETLQMNDDVIAFLNDWQTEQKEYEQKVLEVQNFISDQTKNITSMFFVLILAFALLSGIILARIVWRKF